MDIYITLLFNISNWSHFLFWCLYCSLYTYIYIYFEEWWRDSWCLYFNWILIVDFLLLLFAWYVVDAWRFWGDKEDWLDESLSRIFEIYLNCFVFVFLFVFLFVFVSFLCYCFKSSKLRIFLVISCFDWSTWMNWLYGWLKERVVVFMRCCVFVEMCAVFSNLRIPIVLWRYLVVSFFSIISLFWCDFYCFISCCDGLLARSIYVFGKFCQLLFFFWNVVILPIFKSIRLVWHSITHDHYTIYHHAIA